MRPPGARRPSPSFARSAVRRTTAAFPAVPLPPRTDGTRPYSCSLGRRRRSPNPFMHSTMTNVPHPVCAVMAPRPSSVVLAALVVASALVAPALACPYLAAKGQAESAARKARSLQQDGGDGPVRTNPPGVPIRDIADNRLPFQRMVGGCG